MSLPHLPTSANFHQDIILHIQYMVFGFYLTAVLALVGFPNIMSLKVELTVNIIPFVYMIDDFVNACLNVLLFVPFGFFLPVLWKEFRNAKKYL